MKKLRNQKKQSWQGLGALTAMVASFLALVLPSLTNSGARSAEEEIAVRPIIEIDRPMVLKGDTAPIFVLIRFDAAEIKSPDTADRPPLNLSLVLDRSGSMEDKGKMEYLKKAAVMVVDRLNAKDHLAVVEYDDQITVMWPSQAVESTFAVKRLIEALEPRGSTNLVGGMMRGADEVSDRLKKIDADKAVSRVLLLSDGLANEGVTEPREIRRLVRSAKTGGVRISTMGLGRDYDEDLMQTIAENGGGNYYYIEHPNQMARIFEQELKTLFTTVAKDVRFNFEAEEGIKDISVISFGAADDPKATKFDMENFYGGEKRTLLLRIEPKEGLFDEAGSTVTLGNISFKYHDVTQEKAANFEASVTVQVSEDEAVVKNAVNHDVLVEATLFEVERKHTLAISQYEAGNYEEAEKQMSDLEQDIADKNLTYKDDRLKNKMEALRVERDQMNQAAASVDDRNAYLKSSKQRLFNAQKGKRAQYLLQMGDKGFEVEQLQTALTQAGYYSGPIDGIYSEDVKTAIEALQAAKAMDVDGVAGPATMQELGLY